jgi:hypothetical protein
MAMSEKALGGFNKWTDRELAEKERSLPSHHVIGNEIRAEMAQRAAVRQQRQRGINNILAWVSAVAAVVAAIASVWALLK